MSEDPPAGFTLLQPDRQFLTRAGRLFVRTASEGVPLLATRIEQHQSNSAGFAHGGFLLTLAEVALSLASGGRMLSLSADFLRPARLGSWIVAESCIGKASRSVIFADVTISCGDLPLLQARGLYKPGATPTSPKSP